MAKYQIKVDMAYPDNESLYLDLLRDDATIARGIHFDLTDLTCDQTEDAALLLRVLFQASKNVYDSLRFLLNNPEITFTSNIFD